MKVFKWMATAMFALFFMSAYATDPVDQIGNDEKIIFDVKSVDGKSFVLKLANLQKQRTNVIIDDLSEPNTLFYKRLKNHNGFAQRINLADLEDGRYKITIQQGDEQWIKVLRIEDDQLMFSDTVKL